MSDKGNGLQYRRTASYTAAELCGEEHDEAMRKLVNQENDIRKLWAYRLREFVNAAYPEDNSTALALRSVMLEVVSKLDPDSGDDGANGEYARSEYAGNGWVKP